MARLGRRRVEAPRQDGMVVSALRKKLNDPRIGIGVCAVVVVAIGVVALWSMNGRAEPWRGAVERWWYMDMDSGELFSGPADATPPILTPSGQLKGMRAYVYACGDCNDPAQRYVLSLEQLKPAGEGVDRPTIFVGTPDGQHWYEEGRSRQAIALVTPRPCPPDKPLQRCLPPQ